MKTPIEVDPVRLAENGQLIIDAGGQLRTEAARLDAEAAAEGEPWGDDDLGCLIGLAYSEVRDMTMEVLHGNIDEMLYLAEALQLMASSYQDSDDAAADDMFRAGLR